MNRDSITIEETVEFLNSMFKTDPTATHLLFSCRVTCNEDLADHPSIQVRCEGDNCSVGVIGLLNGLFGTNKEGWGFIASVYDVDDDGKPTSLIGFKVLTKRLEKARAEGIEFRCSPILDSIKPVKAG